MPEKMRAAVVYGINDLRVETVDKPILPDRSILIQVKACAICGTDKRIYRQGDYRAVYPVIVGHEIAGVVVEVAPGITDFKEGDRVCVAPGHGCGNCRMCKSGQPNVCLTPHPSLGYKLSGGFAEYMAVPEHILRLGFVNLIPDSLSFKQASMSEIIACCINAQSNTGVRSGDRVLIIGAGPAGIIHAHLSKLSGAGKVILTQRSRPRLDMAKKLFGDIVDDVICSSEEDLTQAVMRQTDGEGADVVFVCAPSREAQEQAVRLAASRGRINLFGGLPKDDCIISLDANQIHYKELFLSGASSSLPGSNAKALELLATKKINADKLITHTFSLEDIHKGFDILEERQCIKVVIKP